MLLVHGDLVELLLVRGQRRPLSRGAGLAGGGGCARPAGARRRGLGRRVRPAGRRRCRRWCRGPTGRWGCRRWCRGPTGRRWWWRWCRPAGWCLRRWGRRRPAGWWGCRLPRAPDRSQQRLGEAARAGVAEAGTAEAERARDPASGASGHPQAAGAAGVADASGGHRHLDSRQDPDGLAKPERHLRILPPRAARSRWGRAGAPSRSGRCPQAARPVWSPPPGSAPRSFPVPPCRGRAPAHRRS